MKEKGSLQECVNSLVGAITRAYERILSLEEQLTSVTEENAKLHAIAVSNASAVQSTLVALAQLDKTQGQRITALEAVIDRLNRRTLPSGGES